MKSEQTQEYDDALAQSKVHRRDTETRRRRTPENIGHVGVSIFWIGPLRLCGSIDFRFLRQGRDVIAQVPTIETARLRLRGHRVDDFGNCAAMWADPVVTRHIGGRPFSAEEVWGKILRYAGLWSLLGFGYWVIEEEASGRFVGEVGFADFKREIEPSFAGAPEIGWALATWAHGAGFATEAVGAAVAWGDGHFGSTQTVCLIGPDNAASIRVAEKCGYREFERTTYKDHPTILFRRYCDGRQARPALRS